MSDRQEARMARLREILDAYGAGPARWPAAERAWVLALLDSSSEARALRDEAAALDLLIDRAETPAPSPELIADILAAASPSAWHSWASVLWPFGPLWQPAAGLAMAALFGLLLGAAVPGPAEVAGLVAEIDSLILG